jgi:DNA-binding transcriptional LysR family regulator
LLEIADEAIVAGVSTDDALATCPTLPLGALADRTLLSLPRGTGIRSIFDDACARIGLQPRIALEASNLGILARLASLGLGVAIVPESVAAATAGLHAIEIIDPPMRGKVALAWRSGGSVGPAAQALIHRARGWE